MAKANEVPHGHLLGKICRLMKDITGVYPTQNNYGGWDETPYLFKKGDLVKVVMVSRFGDCGITYNIEATHRYQARVLPEDLD